MSSIQHNPPIKEHTFDTARARPPIATHVTMSGGGTRAALASGGANLALLEAKLKGQITVESMTAVSGSAIMLTRLLIAGSHLPNGLAAEDAVAVARRNVHGVWRHGFRQSIAADAVVGFAVILSGLAASLMLGSILGRPASIPVIVQILVAAIGALPASVIVRRWMPFNAMHRTRAGWDRFSTPIEQADWFGCDQDRATPPLLPTSEIQFTTVNLDTLTAAAHSPWDLLYSESPGQEQRRLPIGELATASAAVPFHSGWVGITGQQHADGGVLDNLGIGAALAAVGPDEELLVVDASAPVRAISDRARLDQSGGALVRYLGSTVAGAVAGMVVVALVAIATGAPPTTLILLWGLVLTVVGLRPISGVLLEMLLEGKDSFSVEFRALAAIQRQQKQAALDGLDRAGIKYKLVGLPPPDQVGDSPDFATKLTRVEPETGREIVLHAYLSTCDYLGLAPSATTVAEIESWEDRGLRSRIGRQVKQVVKAALAGALRGLARTAT